VLLNELDRFWLDDADKSVPKVGLCVLCVSSSPWHAPPSRHGWSRRRFYYTAAEVSPRLTDVQSWHCFCARKIQAARLRASRN